MYVNRCEEDVRIQTALWQQMWKHLLLMYKTPEAAWRLVDHLNFKAHCVALQEKVRWRIDLDKARPMAAMFEEKYTISRAKLEECMPDVPEYTTKKPPKKPFKADRTLSQYGQAWADTVTENVDEVIWKAYGQPVNYPENIKVVKGYNPPKASSSVQVKAWLDSMGWVPESFKYVRNKETNEQRVIPQVKDQDTGLLCESIVRMIPDHPELAELQELTIVKHRWDIVKGLLANADSEGFIEAGAQGLTNTLRLKHRTAVNLPSARKPYGLLIRGLFIARSQDTELCGADMCSLEDRTKQHFMWPHDKQYVLDMMEPGFCGHLDMAISANLMTEEDSEWYKNGDHTADPERKTALGLVRHGGKQTNYAAQYGAQAPTVARSAGVSLELGEVLVDAYWERNWSVKVIADEQVVIKSRGLKWLWNPVMKMYVYLKAEKDRFSTLNQSTATYCFDRWLFHVLEKREQLTAQFHDEGIWELKKGNREAMTKILKDAIAAVNEELKLNRDLDIDVQFGDNYGEIH